MRSSGQNHPRKSQVCTPRRNYHHRRRRSLAVEGKESSTEVLPRHIGLLLHENTQARIRWQWMTPKSLVRHGCSLLPIWALRPSSRNLRFSLLHDRDLRITIRSCIAPSWTRTTAFKQHRIRSESSASNNSSSRQHQKPRLRRRPRRIRGTTHRSLHPILLHRNFAASSSLLQRALLAHLAFLSSHLLRRRLARQRPKRPPECLYSRQMTKRTLRHRNALEPAISSMKATRMMISVT